MKNNPIFLVFGVVFFLSGCGSPAKDFMQLCDGPEAECKCMADYIDDRISSREFRSLNQILKDNDGDELSEMLLSDGIVNDNVTEVFFTAAKLCE